MIRRLLVFVIICSGALHAADVPVRHFNIPALYHVGFWVRDIAKSRAFYHDFLGYEEPYALNRVDGSLQMVVMKVNESQVIYLFPDATKILPNGDNLDHLGLQTDDAEALHAYLVAQGVKASDVHRGRIGDLILTVRDPDGHVFEITQFAPEGELLKHQGKSLAADRISNHLRSATIMVTDAATSLRFYRDILGFKKVAGARGTASICLQVPDGSDCLYLLPIDRNKDAPTHSVPEFCLEVLDVAVAAKTLATRAKALGLSPPSPISSVVEGVQETTVVDPDGTRVVLIGKVPRP